MGSAEIGSRCAVVAGYLGILFTERAQLVNALSAERRGWNRAISKLTGYDRCAVCGDGAAVDMGTWALCDTHFAQARDAVEVAG